MVEEYCRAIKSLDELTNSLNEKYSALPGYRSSSRFPSLLIFFNRKDDYVKFINLCNYKKVHFQEFIKDSQIVTKEACDRWIRFAIEESKDEAVMLLPISEIIRLRFLENKERMCDYLFGRILQAEGSRIIVPIPDLIDEYKTFISEFEHKARCGEAWYFKNEEAIEEKINVIADRSGLVEKEDVSKNSIWITNLKQWMDLWSGNELKEERTIIIREPNLINPILSRGIEVPKVYIETIEDEKKYLAKFFEMSDIPEDVQLSTERWTTLIEYIRKRNDRRFSWKRLNKELLGLPQNTISSLITGLWCEEGFPNKELERSLWLIEAKRKGADEIEIGALLKATAEGISDPRHLLDVLYKQPLLDPTATSLVLKQRRELFQAFRYSIPHFEDGKMDIQLFFEKHIEDIPEARRWEYLTGHFDFEKKYLVKLVTDALRKDGYLQNEFLLSIKSVWEPLFHYVSITSFDDGSRQKLLDSINQGHLTDPFTFQEFLKCYRSEYVKSKLMDEQTDLLKELQRHYIAAFKEMMVKTNLGVLRGFNNENQLSKIRMNKLILLDAVGYEWTPVLIGVFDDLGWSLANEDYNLAALPSDTAHCPVVEDSEKIYRKFDELIHSQYRYPDTIFDELSCLTSIIEEVSRDFRGRDTLTLISDHGSTMFARKGDIITTEADKAHGGRYAIVREDGDAKVNNVNVYPVEVRGERSLVMLSYSNFNNRPHGEAHGGATLEEMASAQLTFRRKTEIPNIFNIAVIGDYSLLDKSIRFSIGLACIENVSSAELFVNDGLPFDLPINSIERSEFEIEMSKLRVHGLAEGENIIRIRVVGVGEASCSVHVSGATTSNSFNDLFN